MNVALDLGLLRAVEAAALRVGNDLPGEAEPVLQPAALAFLAASGDEGVPVLVDFLLVTALHEEGDGFGESEFRPAIEPMNSWPHSRKLDVIGLIIVIFESGKIET